MTAPAVICIRSDGRVVVQVPDDAQRVELDRQTFDELVALANRRFDVTPQVVQ